MKELEVPAINELISIFSKLNQERESNEENIKKAKFLYDRLSPGCTLLSSIVNTATENLFSFAYPHSGSKIKKPSRKEIQKIIEELKKRKKELEK